MRTANGLEFCCQEFESRLVKCGIEHQRTGPYTSQQNGTSERMNRTLEEKARCMIFDADLDKTYWAEAVNVHAYQRSCRPFIKCNISG